MACFQMNLEKRAAKFTIGIGIVKMNEKNTPSKEALLKDLELQWKDHFHMRDQTWKTLTNTILFFLGTVGLEIKGVGKYVMIVAYVALMLVALFGWAVAAHHRIRQGQKFAFITEYEKRLGLDEIKEPVLSGPILSGKKGQVGILGSYFTARFIEIMELAIAVVAISLLIRTSLGH